MLFYRMTGRIWRGFRRGVGCEAAGVREWGVVFVLDFFWQFSSFRQLSALARAIFFTAPLLCFFLALSTVVFPLPPSSCFPFRGLLLASGLGILPLLSDRINRLGSFLSKETEGTQNKYDD